MGAGVEEGAKVVRAAVPVRACDAELNVKWHNMTAQSDKCEAVNVECARKADSPWLGRSNDAGEVAFEHGVTDAVKLQLAELGHRVSPTTGLHGGYQAIWRTDDPLVYFGGSDPRKDGAAMGY